MPQQQKKKKKKNGVPERWLNYDPVGQRIPGTRFIAFKVPLKPSLNSRVPQLDSFSLWDLVDAVQKQNQELGLIIDLTFTTRYYELRDVPQSCSYIKIFTEGHHVPSDDTILRFKQAVRWFLQENRDNNKLIGVHCTHGVNRTGYLVCRYLIDVDGLDPGAAVELFNACRGHRIERQNYLDDLEHGAKRSNRDMDEAEEVATRGTAEEQPLPAATVTMEMKRPAPAVATETKRPATEDPAEEIQRPLRSRRRVENGPCDGAPPGGLLPTPPTVPLQPRPLLRQYCWTDDVK